MMMMTMMILRLSTGLAFILIEWKDIDDMYHSFKESVSEGSRHRETNKRQQREKLLMDDQARTHTHSLPLNLFQPLSF